MGETPRKHCPSCENRRVLVAVEKKRGEPLYRCLCKPCAEEQGYTWGNGDGGEPLQDEHDDATGTEQRSAEAS